MYLVTINSFNWESEDFQMVQLSDQKVTILTNIYMRYQMTHNLTEREQFRLKKKYQATIYFCIQVNISHLVVHILTNKL